MSLGIEELLYVHGEVIRHYAERSDLSEARLAAKIYEGVKSPGAARQRLRLLKQDGVRLLGSGELAPHKEAVRLSTALGVEYGTLVNSRLLHVLVKPEGGLFVAGGAVMGWPESHYAMVGAELVAEHHAGPWGPEVYGPAPLSKPLVHATTEADLRDKEEHMGWAEGWRLIVGGFGCVDDFQWLLDVERHYAGEPGLADALAWRSPHMIFGHMAPLFDRIPETPRHRWQLDSTRDLIARAMEIKCSPEREAELHGRREELLGRLMKPWNVSEAREGALFRAVGLDRSPSRPRSKPAPSHVGRVRSKRPDAN
jgi:hypothetical protein